MTDRTSRQLRPSPSSAESASVNGPRPDVAGRSRAPRSGPTRGPRPGPSCRGRPRATADRLDRATEALGVTASAYARSLLLNPGSDSSAPCQLRDMVLVAVFAAEALGVSLDVSAVLDELRSE